MKEYDSTETVAPQSQGNASIHQLGQFSIIVGFLATVFLVGALIADHNSVTTTVVGGLIFFTLYVAMVMLFLSGQLESMFNTYQKETTTRLRDKMQYSLYMQPVNQSNQRNPVLIEPEQIGDEQVSLSRFVPAVPSVEEGIKIASYDFVYNLFDQKGAPDPDRILPEESNSPGQIQLKKPRREVVEYLLSLGMVWLNERKMLFFNTDRYNTLVEAKRAIKHGVRSE